MDSKKSILCILFVWMTSSVTSQIRFYEKEIREIHSAHISSLCPDSLQRTFYFFAHFSIRESEGSEKEKTFLCKMDEWGNLLRKEPFSESSAGLDFSRSIRGPMVAFPSGPLLVLNNPLETRLGTLTFHLFKREADDPNLLILADLKPPYVFDVFSSVSGRPKVLRLNPEFCLFSAYNKEADQESFFVSDRSGNVCKIISMERGIRILDYENHCDGQIIFVGGQLKVLANEQQRWEYQTGIVDVEKGHITSIDYYQTEPYKNGMESFSKNFRPRIARKADGTFFCLFSSTVEQELVAIKARQYTERFSYLGEKELFRTQAGFLRNLPGINTLEIAPLGKEYFVILVYTNGWLSFRVMDENGCVVMQRQPWKEKKMFGLESFVTLSNSVIAFGKEWDSLKDTIGRYKLYSLTLSGLP